MKNNQKVIFIGLLTLALLIGVAFYAVGTSGRSSRCDTSGVRPDDCIPTNNRCTPPGDPSEAFVDCKKALYYEAPTTNK